MHNPYEEEARERWGDTDAWSQSAQRTSRYTDAEWAEVQAEADEVNRLYAEALRSGAGADSPAAMDAAEAHRRHIHTRFYELTAEMHLNLGEMYVADPRFTEYYERIEPGLAAFVRDAIRANAGRS